MSMINAFKSETELVLKVTASWLAASSGHHEDRPRARRSGCCHHNSLRLERRDGPLLSRHGPTDAPSGRRSPAARRLPRPTQRRALELLADCPQEGCTEAVMLAHGLTVAQLVELVRAGLATATPRRVKAGRERLEIAVLRITEAGRRCWRGCHDGRQGNLHDQL
jgi:hypothetical protein